MGDVLEAAAAAAKAREYATALDLYSQVTRAHMPLRKLWSGGCTRCSTPRHGLPIVPAASPAVTTCSAAADRRRAATAARHPAQLQAIESDPASAAALAARASVHNKMNNHMEAAADASRAAELDDGLAAAHKEKGCVPSSTSCRLTVVSGCWTMPHADRTCCREESFGVRLPQPEPAGWLRSPCCPPCTCCRLACPSRSLACYHLEEFESAMDAFEAAAALEPGKGIHRQWINMCKVQLGGEAWRGTHRPHWSMAVLPACPATHCMRSKDSGGMRWGRR